MNELLLIYLSLSLSASVLIVFLFFCKPLVKDKLSRQWQYYIWLIVIARLLLPLASEGNLLDKTFESIGRAYYGEESPSYEDDDSSTLPLLSSNSEKSSYGFSKEENTGFYPLQEAYLLLAENVWLVWVGIALILFIQKITVYKSFIRYVRAGMEPVTNVELLDQVAVIGNQIGVNIACDLCVNPLISSPLLIGFIRPCIVIPSTKISNTSFRFIVMHELTHYRRCDMFYKWLVQITLCLHWFNPFVYLMEKEITKSCEFSCDEVVLKKVGSGYVKDYGNTLLETMALAGQYKEILASITLSENKKILKERICAIMKFKHKSRLLTCIAFLLTFFLLVGAAMLGAYTSINHASSIPSDNQAIIDKTSNEVSINVEISAGGVEIIQSSLEQIKADYDTQYYDVKLVEENGEYKATVIGKKADMGAHYVKLSLPDTSCSITANVICGSLVYTLPQKGNNSLHITAEDSSLKFFAPNQYENTNISIAATDQEFMQYGYINYPDYFSKTENKVFYKNGSDINEINIMLTGFTNVDFE